MFIEQAYRGKHEWWRYFVGTLAIFFCFFLGQIPLSIVVLLGAVKNTGHSLTSTSTKALLDASGLSANMFTFLMLLSFAVGLLSIYLVVKYWHKRSFTSLTTSRKKIDWKRFFFSFSLIAVYIIASTLIDYNANPDNYELQFQWMPFIILFIISIVLVPIQTSFEEYLFRGYLMQGLGVLTKNRWFPLIITSLCFGGLHFSNPEVSQFGPLIMFYYVGTGLFLGITTLMDEGMELSMGFHASNNLIQVLLVTSDWSAFQSPSILRDLTNPSEIGGEIIFALLVFYPILLLIFTKVYHWKNWKSRLTGRVTPPLHIEN